MTAREWAVFSRTGHRLGAPMTDRDKADEAVRAQERAGYDVDLRVRDYGPWRDADALPVVTAREAGEGVRLSEEVEPLAKWLWAISCDLDRVVGVDLDDRSAANNLASLLVDRFESILAAREQQVRAETTERVVQAYREALVETLAALADASRFARADGEAGEATQTDAATGTGKAVGTTGAGREATSWDNRSEDCPKAPAQASRYVESEAGEGERRG